MKMSIDKAIRFALLAPFVAGMIIYGGGKPGPGQRPSRFFFDDYLSDIGSYSTNDIVHVASVKSSLQIPDDTPMHVYAALMGTTNWTELLPSRTYADQPADWTLADATNYDYIVMLDWVPPAPVVTNDILTVNALAAKGSTPPGKTLHAVLPRVALVTPIEYLESTGTQWIDTGIDTSTISKYVTDTAMLGVGAEGSNVTPYIFIGIHASKVFYGYVGQSSPTAIPADNDRHIFEAANTGVVANDGFYIDGVKAKDRGTGTVASAPFYLFACYQSGNLRFYLRQRKYTAKIYCNGVLVRDFQPVRVGRVGYLFDRVSGELFGNAGTGAFILGPDITE